MIVELIGCAGAGKTTLARMMRERGVGERRVRTMADLVVDRPLLRRVSHPTAVNVLQEVGSFPFFVGGRARDRDFLVLSRHMLAHSRSRFDRLNGMRGIVRKVGMYRLATSRAQDSIVLSDEGTLLSAYNLFVMTDVEVGRADVDAFLRVVPMPDRVVHVRAPVPVLVERARSRATPRRQHRGRTIVDVERDVRRTVELFDLVASSPLVADRLLVVDNDDGEELGRRRVAEEIAHWLEGAAAPGHLLGGHAVELELGSRP